jgi:protein involved in polysaccharide export with SLBB domain
MMKRMRKIIAVVVAVLVSISSVMPSLAVAQDLSPNAGGGYGQALGQRRTQTRPLSPDGNNTMDQSPGLSYEQGGMGRSRGMGGMGGVDANAYQIHILGMVRHPGTYRLPPSTRMAEAIDIAGGVLPKGSMRRIELRRGNRTIRTYDLNAFLADGKLDQNPFLLDNDEIFVPGSERVVSVQGPVNRTGVLELTREVSLKDLVNLADGYTVGILMSEPATVIRYVDGKKIVYHIALVDGDMASFEVKDGDIIVFPHVLTKGRKFDYNIATLPNDNLFYPSFNDNVFVMGAISQPGAYPFNPFYDVRHYINMAGAVRYANLKRIKILDMNGKEIKYKEGYRLNPGDTVVVPYRAWTTDNVLKWYNTLASTVFTGFALQQLIKNQ